MGLRLLNCVARFLSAEWVLTRWPNGGGVVLFRSTWIAGLAFLAAIALTERLHPMSVWAFSPEGFQLAVRAHIHWLGAIFAGVYASLYARFASQWTYLAGVYNQLMASQVAAPADDNPERKRVYSAWKAGFIEDAMDVHLALKPSYAYVIAGLLRDSEVRRQFLENTHNGKARLAQVQAAVRRVVGDDPAPKAPLTQLQPDDPSGKQSLDEST